MGLADRVTDAPPVSNEAGSLPAGQSASPHDALKRKGLAGRIAALVGFLSGEKATSVPAGSADAEALRWQQDAELDSLRQKLTALESENAQLRAKPTETRKKEDPAPAEGRPSANRTAYQRDAESLFY